MRRQYLLPFAVFFFLYFPLVVFSFDIGIANVAGISGIKILWDDKGLAAIFFSSIAFAAAAACIATCIGFAAAFLIIKSNLTFAGPFLFLYILPIAVPSFVSIEAVLFLSEKFGTDLYSAVTLIIVTSFTVMPFSVIIISAGLQSVPRTIEEAARLNIPDKRWFRIVTLPFILPYITSAFILTFVFAFTNYELPSLMNVQTYTLHIFNQFGAFYDFGNAAQLVQPAMVLLACVMVVQFLILGNRSFFDLTPVLKGLRYPLGKTGRICSYIFLNILSLVILFPVAVIFPKIFGHGPLETGLLPVFVKETGYTFLLNILAAFTAIACSIPYVKFMADARGKLRRLLFFCSLLPLAIPSSFFAIGLIRLSSKFSFDTAISASVALCWGLAARFFPVVCQTLYAGSLSVNPRLSEAAEIAHASAFYNFIHIWLPLHLPVIGKAFLFFLLLSVGEIGLAVLLVPPDCMTASVNIYSMLHYGFKKEVAIETLMVLMVSMTSGVFILNMFRKGPADDCA